MILMNFIAYMLVGTEIRYFKIYDGKNELLKFVCILFSSNEIKFHKQNYYYKKILIETHVLTYGEPPEIRNTNADFF